jgi:hypothetical protein
MVVERDGRREARKGEDGWEAVPWKVRRETEKRRSREFGAFERGRPGYRPDTWVTENAGDMSDTELARVVTNDRETGGERSRRRCWGSGRSAQGGGDIVDRALLKRVTGGGETGDGRLDVGSDEVPRQRCLAGGEGSIRRPRHG